MRICTIVHPWELMFYSKSNICCHKWKYILLFCWLQNELNTKIYSYLRFATFLHINILSHENFTLGKSVNLRQNCPVTKQCKSPSQTYISNWTNYTNNTLSVKFYTECKILHWVQHNTLNVKFYTECNITHWM